MNATGKRSVILLSGGLDSAANLAFCRKFDLPILAVTLRYGQKAQDQEVYSARQLCHHYDVRHEVVDLEWLGGMGGSSLTESAGLVPSMETHQLDDMRATSESAKSVWVPNRNGVFINVAAAFAERYRAERVVVGFNREEAATFPDNSAEFIKRANAAFEFSTATQVKVFSYTVAMDKTEIVAEVKKMDPRFPWDTLWSCYQGEARVCGICESCRRFTRAVQGR